MEEKFFALLQFSLKHLILWHNPFGTENKNLRHFSSEDAFLRYAKLGRDERPVWENFVVVMCREERGRDLISPTNHNERRNSQGFMSFLAFAALLLRITMKCRSNCKVSLRPLATQRNCIKIIHFNNRMLFLRYCLALILIFSLHQRAHERKYNVSRSKKS